MRKRSSIRFRITAWYDWLLVVLVLTFGAYTYTCLKCCLSIGVEDALSLRAKLISSAIARTGQVPPRRMPLTHGLHALLLSVRDAPHTPQTDGFAPSTVRHPWKAPALSARNSDFLIGTAPLTLGDQRYVVEVAAPTHSLKALLHEVLKMLLLSLSIGLGLATLGSWFLISRALVPVHNIALIAQALPITSLCAHRDSATVRDEIGRLCITVNEMLGQWEQSFESGTGPSAEGVHSLCTRLGTLRGELAALFAHLRMPIGFSESVVGLLKETERLNTFAWKLSTPLPEDPGQTRLPWFRLYLSGLSAARVEHICVLSETLGADCLRHSQPTWNEASHCHW